MSDISSLVDSLETYATSIETANPESDGTDVLPLANAIGNARIVGMGEATHGTSEFFTLKHRIFRLLIEELGFRIFVLEANFSETLAINDYVLYGEGNPEEALDGIYFWVWNTKEVLALIKWIRSFNEGRPIGDRVRFYGIDAQYTQGAAKAIRQYLQTADADYLEEIRGLLDSLAAGRKHVATTDERLLETAEGMVSELGDRFEDNRLAYIDRTSADEWELVRQHVRVLSQVIEYASLLNADEQERKVEHRDRSMAANVEWILDYEATETIALWAHNIHISKHGTDRAEGLDTSLGELLVERFGDDYYALGFEFSHGSFRAYPSNPTKGEVEVETITVGRLTEDWPDDEIDEESVGLSSGVLGTPAFNEVVSSIDSELFFLDIDGAASDATLESWLGSPHLMNRIGALFLDSRFDFRCIACEFPNAFDGLLFVKETNAAMPL